jgi:hypothetical protein
MTKPKKTEPKPEENVPPVPPPADPSPAAPELPVLNPLASEKPAEPISSASLVASDTDKFEAKPLIPPLQGTSPIPEPPPPQFPDKPPGYKGTGRPKGSKTSRKGPQPNSGASTVPNFEVVEPERDPVDYDALAALGVDMFTQTMSMIIGPEWMPGKIKGPDGSEFDEKIVLLRPLKKYLESKQVPDLPPGVMLCFAVVMYSSIRFRQPNTREKLGGFFKAAKDKVFGWFKWRKKMKPGFVRSPEPRPEPKQVEPEPAE